MISISFLKEDPDKLLTDQELSKAGIRSVPSLQRDRWAGQGFPFVRIGRSVFYRAGDVLDHIESSRVTPDLSGNNR